MRRILIVAVLAACGSTTPAEAPPAAPPVVEVAPALAPVAPARHTATPYARPLTPAEAAARETLRAFVQRRGLDPSNAWSIGHALLALGPDAKLADGTGAVDHLFTRFGEVTEVAGQPLVGFAKTADGHPVEPHSELVLKKLTDLGLGPDRPIVVQGRTLTLADLWRGALYRTWVDGEALSVASWNDTPWALQAIAAWAPPHATWTAAGGHAMSLDDFTHAVVGKLVEATAFLAEAKRTDGTFEKRGQGIFGYTCGGAHLLQSSGYAVARGFGEPGDAAVIAEQVRLQAWRFPRELAQVDRLLVQAPQHAVLLLVQRLKFTGHHLETMTRASALGLVPADDAEIRASIDAGRAELTKTVAQIQAAGLLEHADQIRAQKEQVFLDLVGDGAHAVRALDLAAGTAEVVW